MTDREQLRDRLIRRALAAHLIHAALDAITPEQQSYRDIARVIDALGVVEMAEALDAAAGQKIGWTHMVRVAVRKVRAAAEERADAR